MSDAPHARTTETDGVLTVTLDRPDRLNPISPQITEVLWQAVEAMAARDDLRVLVLQLWGATSPRASTSVQDRDSAPTPSRYRWDYRRHHLLYDELEALEKPVVLAAHGPCLGAGLGAGLEMAGSCDVRLASTEATFRLPEIDLAVIAGSAGTSRITRLVGPHWGKWLAMAGKPVEADRALMIGLVHDVYALEGFHDRVHEFAVSLAALPRGALGLAKLAVDMCANTDPATARHVERLASTTLALGQEHRYRVQEFQRRAAERASRRAQG